MRKVLRVFVMTKHQLSWSQLRAPHSRSMCFFVYLRRYISWSDYAAPDPLKRACLCFFTWVSSHLHRSFPVPVCSWHIFSPNSLLWFILPWSFFSTGGPHVIIIILLLGCILSDGNAVANERRWGKWVRKWLFPVGDGQGGQHEKSSC